MIQNYSYFTHLECPKCKEEYDGSTATHLCVCGSPLLARYDLLRLKEHWSIEQLKTREPTLWRYHEVLPVLSPANRVSLGEGMTPLVHMKTLGKTYELPNLCMKDEGLLPTGSFKARGAAVGVSKAKELGVQTLAMPTNGNAGAAWALYSSRAGIQSHIVMPLQTPEITKREVISAGGTLSLIDGLIHDAGHAVSEASKEYGWYNVSTLKEPYRIEGKKTMGYEIFEQYGFHLPNVILYPTGGGVGLIGIYKAFLELKTLGWIANDATLPRLVAVQSETCAPIVKAYEQRKSHADVWENAETIAFGINVPKAIGDFLVLEAIYETNGCALAVSDEELLAEQKQVAEREGNWICPEGGATFAAAKKLRQSGWIQEDEHVLCLNTGMGIKYPDTVTYHDEDYLKHSLTIKHD